MVSGRVRRVWRRARGAQRVLIRPHENVEAQVMPDEYRIVFLILTAIQKETDYGEWCQSLLQLGEAVVASGLGFRGILVHQRRTVDPL